MGIGSAIFSVLGAMNSAAGAYKNAAIEKSNLYMQAGLADTNARISELAAQSEFAASKKRVAALTMQAGQLKSKQRTGLASSGVDLSAGSAREIQASADLMKEIDILQAEQNAIRSAWGHRIQSTNYKNSANIAIASAQGINPGMAAFSSLLSSASGVASSWKAFSSGGGSTLSKSSGNEMISSDLF